MRTINAFAAVFLAVGAAGCNNGFVQNQTSGAVREFAIVPVFPFRENFMVGDIYEDTDNLPSQSLTTNQGFPTIGAWADYLDLTKELDEFYGKRYSFPATPVTDSTVSVPAGQSIFSPGDSLQRLRVVALPTFATATTTVGQIAAYVPVQTAASISAAAGVQSNDTVSISVPVAESYGLPVTTVMSKFFEMDANRIKQMYRFIHRPNVSDPTVRLRLITEVVYARSIDLNITSARGGGFLASATFNSKLLGAGSGVAPPGVGNASTQPTQDATTNPTSNSIVSALNQQLQQSTAGMTTPGARVQYIAASDSSITLRATFDRPVAIGFRGMLVNITPLGKATLGGTVSTSTPR